MKCASLFPQLLHCSGQMPPAPREAGEARSHPAPTLACSQPTMLWWPNDATQRLCPIACCWQHQAYHTERNYSMCSHWWVGLNPNPVVARVWLLGGPLGAGGFAQGSAVCGVSLLEQAPSPSSPKPLPLGSKPTHCVFLLPERPCIAQQEPAWRKQQLGHELGARVTGLARGSG